MPPKPWYRKIFDAVVSGVSRLDEALRSEPSEPPKREPPKPQSRNPFRRRQQLPPEPPKKPFPPSVPPERYVDDSEIRRETNDLILRWFPDDGRWETGDEFRKRTGKRGGRRGGRHGKHITNYRSSQGLSRGPASPIQVARMLRDLSPDQMREILEMTREEFQTYAREHGLKYH